MNTYECFLYPVSPTEAARVPFPADVPLDKRAAYMAKPPAAAVAAAERVPLTPTVPATPAAPAVTSPDSED